MRWYALVCAVSIDPSWSSVCFHRLASAYDCSVLLLLEDRRCGAVELLCRSSK